MNIFVEANRVMKQTSPAALQLLGISKRFGNLNAVDDVNLELRRGEFLTLLGSSGSGKTTTLNMVAGFLQPSAGRVLIDGQDATNIPTHKRGIGMVFQNYALFPHLTVAQNIAFPLTRVPVGERTAKIREALQIVGLGGLEDRYPRQLSGGQQQRVAFARAVVYRPSLLLMDEPFGALDKKLRETLQLEARRLHLQLGITVLHVTHDQEEALVLSDRIAIFNKGRIEQLDDPRGIYDRPKTVFVADFIGDANILHGTIVRQGDELAIKGENWCLSGSVRSGQPLHPESRGGLVIRPDKVLLARLSSPASPDTQRIIGRIRQVVYLGGTLKYEVEALGQVFYARLRVDASSFCPNPGEETFLEWRSEDGTIVPATGS